MAKLALQAGEALGMRFCNSRIVISQTIGKLVHDKSNGPELGPHSNGVTLPEVPPTNEHCATLKTFGLEPGRDVLMVSRLVPGENATST